MTLHKQIQKYVEESILDFEKIPVERLKIHIEKSLESVRFSPDLYLKFMLEVATNLECYNVCIAARDLLKKLEQ